MFLPVAFRRCLVTGCDYAGKTCIIDTILRNAVRQTCQRRHDSNYSKWNAQEISKAQISKHNTASPHRHAYLCHSNIHFIFTHSCIQPHLGELGHLRFLGLGIMNDCEPYFSYHLNRCGCACEICASKSIFELRAQYHGDIMDTGPLLSPILALTHTHELTHTRRKNFLRGLRVLSTKSRRTASTYRQQTLRTHG